LVVKIIPPDPMADFAPFDQAEFDTPKTPQPVPGGARGPSPPASNPATIVGSNDPVAS